MLVPFLRKLIALRLLIPAGSASSQGSNAPNSATSNPPGGAMGDGLSKFARIARTQTLLEHPSPKFTKEIEQVLENARSLADIVELDDEILMEMMSYDLADKNIYGNVKVVGMGWKSFELRDFFKAPMPVGSGAQSPTPAFERSEGTTEGNGAESRTPNKTHLNGVDTNGHKPHSTSTPVTNIPPSTLGKRARDDEEDSESRSRVHRDPSVAHESSESAYLGLAKTGCFPPILTNDGQVIRRRMRRVGWEVLKNWEIWALDAQEI